MNDPITREERRALIERARSFLDADEYNRFSHSNACALLRALTAAEEEIERLREALAILDDALVNATEEILGRETRDRDYHPKVNRARRAALGAPPQQEGETR